MDKTKMREKHNLKKNTKYALFSSSFSVPRKNYALAEKAIKKLDVKLIELKGYSRIEVAELLNAVDLLILTSFSEGSPQIIKEALACNCPIVATDVGDTKHVCSNIEGCYITSFDAEDVSEKIKLAIEYAEKKDRTKGRDRILSLNFDNRAIAKSIKKIYDSIIK